MANRITYPNFDDIGYGAVQLNAQEFKYFISAFLSCGLSHEDAAEIIADDYAIWIKRDVRTEKLFYILRMQGDVEVLFVCRQGRLSAMKERIRNDIERAQ